MQVCRVHRTLGSRHRAGVADGGEPPKAPSTATGKMARTSKHDLESARRNTAAKMVSMLDMTGPETSGIGALQ